MATEATIGNATSNRIDRHTATKECMLHYLASPYSHPDTGVMTGRYVAACKKAGELISQGIAVISPIAHNVAIIARTGGKTGWETWEKQDKAVLGVCAKLLVLRLPGWNESRGVAGEIAEARRLGIPIEYLD